MNTAAPALTAAKITTGTMGKWDEGCSVATAGVAFELDRGVDASRVGMD